MNEVFNMLPLAAVIEGKVLCMHAGIGDAIDHLQQVFFI
jgi:protein phosphatase